MPARVNITLGSRFGRWTVVSMGESASYGGRKWNCVCDCGAEVQVLSKYLRNGKSQSCGCIQRTHGLSSSPEYGIWRLMLRRCDDPRVEKYHCYGGRGIIVCPEWVASFEVFYRDMGPRPDGYTLERIDVNGNYEPSNCKWDSWANQHKNKRTNVWLTLNGERRLLMDWAEIVGIDKKVLANRYKQGWTDEEILTIPLVKERKRNHAGRFATAR